MTASAPGNRPLRVVFLGSGDFGLPTLDWLNRHHRLVGIMTQPDRPAGRKRRPTPTPVGQWAEDRGHQPIKTDDCNTAEMVEQVRALQPDVGVVVAFGQKLKPALIQTFDQLAINLHGSLLPRYRGAAPINWAVMENERQTGVTVIELAQRMDAGRILAKAEINIDPQETAGEVHDRLAELGPEVIEQVLGDLQHDRLQALPQEETEATRAPKLEKSDGTVDFDQPAEHVRARIHGLTPWPGCRVNWHSQQTGEVTPLTLVRARAVSDARPTSEPGIVLTDQQVSTADGALQLVEVQPPGGKVMAATDFARGHPFSPGDRLTPLAPQPTDR